jgi:flagellar FliL protein
MNQDDISMADEEDLEDEELEEGAEGEEGEDGEGGEKKEGGDKKKLILIIAGVVVLLLAVGAGLFFTGIIGGGGGGDEHATEEEHGEGGHGEGEYSYDSGGHENPEEKGGKAFFLEVPTIVVNLKTEDNVPRYLRLSVQLEVASEEDLGAVETVLPRVIDQFQTYLRELRVKDLRGSGGIYRLQMELLWRVNQAAAPIKVRDVLFQEILIQ